MTTTSTALAASPEGECPWPTETSDRVLERLGGEGLHYLLCRLRRNLHLLPEHHPLPCLRGGPVLQLQHYKLRDHELLSLRHLCVCDVLQLPEDGLHDLRLKLSGLRDPH